MVKLSCQKVNKFLALLLLSLFSVHFWALIILDLAFLGKFLELLRGLIFWIGPEGFVCFSGYVLNLMRKRRLKLMSLSSQSAFLPPSTLL